MRNVIIKQLYAPKSLKILAYISTNVGLKIINNKFYYSFLYLSKNQTVNQANQTLPIGRLLQETGLVSERQVQIALRTQARYNKMRLGEILALQGVLPQKTIDFFAEQWNEVQIKGKQFPIGYYLKRAGLLKEEQIKIILAEQKQNKLKFGNLAIKKGWINQDTIDFFLDNLIPKPPQLISLAALEKYNYKTLHLEKKVANPTLILQEILSWTGGQPILTKIICQILANSDLIVLGGQEKTTVKNLVTNSFIDNWKTKKTAEYIRTVADSLINNQQCEPELLLKTYRKILLRGEIAANQSTEQEELLISGVAIAEENRLRVANPIYQQVLNLDWIEEQLLKIRKPQIQTETDNDKNDIQPMTKLGSIVTLVGILLLAPLVIIFNNYYSKSKLELNVTSSTPSESDELLQLCQNPISKQSKSHADLIVQLEQSKHSLQETFPNECEVMLHKLWVLVAPQLGTENRVIDAVDHLCKIPSDSKHFAQAKIWIDRWYNSPAWGQQTQAYLNLVSDCPVAKDRIMMEDSQLTISN